MKHRINLVNFEQTSHLHAVIASELYDLQEYVNMLSMRLADGNLASATGIALCIELKGQKVAKQLLQLRQETKPCPLSKID